MARLDLKLLHAYLNLAWRSVIHYLRKLNPFHEPYGLARFEKNYIPEGLPPATPVFRAIAHEPGRCTSCAECDAVCPILLEGRPVAGREDPAPFPGPMAVMLAAARSAPHFEDARADLATLQSPTCIECRACDRVCPEHIPIAKVCEVLLDQLSIVEDVRRKVGNA